MVGGGGIVDDTAHHRLLLEGDGSEAELVYRQVGDRLVLVHTEVPEALSGQGIGSRLVRAAVDRARAGRLTLVPYCPFAARWLRAHPDEVAGIPVDWPVGGVEEVLDDG